MTWTSNLPRVQAAIDAAVCDGLTAGARHYAGEVMRDLAGGYTSGAFVTGAVMRSVTVVPAVRVGDTYEALVGTNLLYALFWEVGHQNLFTRRYERQEVWRPRLVWEANRIRAIAQQRAEARLQQMGGAA
jgi:hypothetical protein